MFLIKYIYVTITIRSSFNVENQIEAVLIVQTETLLFVLFTFRNTWTEKLLEVSKLFYL